MMFRTTILSAASLIAPALAFAGAADWPQWMGPQRDGLSPESGLLQSWPAGGPPLLWKATGLGGGFSTVSVVGDRIFTAGDQQDANYVLALSRADGRVLWTAKLGKAGAPGWGGFAGPRGTPTVDGDLLYGVGQYGQVACLETATGKEVWRKDFSGDFGGERPEWGFSASPLVDGDRVILAPGGKQGALAALNKKTGALLWRSESLADPIHYSSPIVRDIGGVRQYIQLTAAHVAGIAADDGRLLWKHARRGQTAVIPTPLHAEGHVYVASGYGIGCNLFQVTAAGGQFAVTEVYKNKVMVNHHGGVIKVGAHVYGFSDGKGWTCQDFKTGEAVWQEKSKLGKGSLVYADGRFYLRQEDRQGTVVLLEATPKAYREHGRFDPPDRSKKHSWPHPVVVGGKLYLRDQDVLLCYDVKAK
ncbi:MAG: PQQ-like beta-propeller repeat protein [Verrucomicrobia bacterium]|nr:PQQ-like beta-propeller repeat protein [Verrucomicrobiota bacterium]